MGRTPSCKSGTVKWISRWRTGWLPGFQGTDASIIYYWVSRLDCLSPLFNDKPEYTAICIWLLCETLNIQSSAGEPERINRGRLAADFTACVLQALKLESNLRSNLGLPVWYSSASVPSTIFSLRKQKCEVPSLCCLWQDSNVYKSTLKYWF